MKATIYILTFLCIACKAGSDRTNLTRNCDVAIPYFVDSSNTSGKAYRTNTMQVPLNYVIYSGKASDTINLNKYDQYNSENYLDFQEYEYTPTGKFDLSLFISEKQLLTIELEDFSIPPMPTEDSAERAKSLKQWKERPREFVQAFPIVIYNPTIDTICLGLQDGRVTMIQEAKDENGVWRPIEFWRYSWCGNSYGALKLIPNKLAVVKVFKYDGDFETEIRLKLRNNGKVIYSDSYKGRINKSQFELPPDIRESYLAKRLKDKTYLDKIFLNN